MEVGNGTNITNSSVNETYVTSAYNLNQEDSNWIVTNSFIIFTMQTGKINEMESQHIEF